VILHSFQAATACSLVHRNVDDTGRIVRELKVANEPEALLAVLKNPAYHFAQLRSQGGHGVGTVKFEARSADSQDRVGREREGKREREREEEAKKGRG
jgi:hypothetical protein